MKFDRILFPVDFSEPNSRVAPYVRAICRHFDSEVLMLHVLIPPNFYAPPGEAPIAIFENWEELRRIRMETLLTFLQNELEGVPVRREIREGDPAHEIVKCAESAQVDLIMMATHGYGPFRALLVGSVTAKVLHDAECPVWTAVHSAEGMPPPGDLWKRIVCAVDLTEEATRSVSWAADLARTAGAELRVLHAIEAFDDAQICAPDDPVIEALTLTARERLLKLLDPAVVERQLTIQCGSPEAAVKKMVGDWDADLIVIGRGKARKVLGGLRSKAHATVRESPCPVISV